MTVFYRDVGIVIGHAMKLLFWVSPILWSFEAAAGRGRALEESTRQRDKTLGLPSGALVNILSYNPVAILLESYRTVIYGNLGASSTARWRDGVESSGNGPPPTSPSWPSSSSPASSSSSQARIIFKRLEPAFAKVL